MDQVSRLRRRPPRTVVAKSTLIGAAPAMIELYKRIAQVAPTEVAVLIVGERGSGKKLVARIIHERSGRASQIFSVLNCAGLAEDTLESRLFGHGRAGVFEEANGGTVFLDEVGSIPAALQGRVLRALQDGEVRRVGGAKTIKVDVRVLAASSRELSIDVARKQMRADLFYRLSVVTLRIPALRDRGDDLVALAHHFVERQAVALGRPIPEIGLETLDQIRFYPWPGNVRELEWAMAQAVARSEGSVLLPEDLPVLTSDPEDAIAHDWPTLAELQRRYIDRVLERTGGNKTQAAAILGVARRTLQRQDRAHR